jgi:hypothetical protein
MVYSEGIKSYLNEIQIGDIFGGIKLYLNHI